MIIGLTGGSGTGKSSACAFFEEKGFVVIDLDKVSRKVCQKGEKCLDEIASVFGNGVIDKDGNLKRRVLGDIVFSDAKKLEMLNSVTHKYIIEETKKIIAENSGRDIVLDAPLLFEAGLDSLCTVTLCILSSRENRIKRIVKRDNISEKSAEARISSQQSDDYYSSRCSICIHNDSDLSALTNSLEAEFGGQNGC